MTTYYVGIGGDDGNSGLTWALRKLTLNGAEDIPVAAGDTVYVGAGTYREELEMDVSGAVGTPITYIGDYLGIYTDGVGGIVRITGSDDDITRTRDHCIGHAAVQTYRTIKGFQFDLAIEDLIMLDAGSDYTVIENCLFLEIAPAYVGIIAIGNTTNLIVRRCSFFSGGYGVVFMDFMGQDNTVALVENCLFSGQLIANIFVFQTGDGTIRNCVFDGCMDGVYVSASPELGHPLVVNNSLFRNHTANAFNAILVTDITENYNNIWNCINARTNTNIGANSLDYPPIFDTRWFFQAVFANQSGKVITPWDLSSYSQLVNVAGTSPTTTDLRGTSVIGSQREWGALEYDPSLKLASRGRLVGGGMRQD